MSKNPPTETKVTPPKPTEGYEQSHLVLSGTVPDPQDLERNIQLASKGLPSTLDEGTRKSQTLPESTAKTTPRPEGSLGDKDSEGKKPPVDMEPIYPTIADPLGTSAKYQEDILGVGEEMDEDPQIASIAETHHQYPSPQADKPQSSHAPSIEASYNDSSCYDTLKKYDNTLPLTERQLVKYLRKVSTALFGRIVGKMIKRDQIDKLVEASMSSLNKSNNTISDLYKCLNIITELLKEINNVVKDNPAHALKQDEELAAWAKSSTNMAWNLGSRISQNHIQSNIVTPTLALTHILANVEGENATNTAIEDPPSHTEGEPDAIRRNPKEPKHSTDANIKFIGSSKPQSSITQAQPITI
ncbi:hypothetical protein Tco_1460097, partial [Tanacetum coccineum]